MSSLFAGIPFSSSISTKRNAAIADLRAADEIRNCNARLVWRYGLALAAITFVTFLPMISLFAASFIASVNGCALDEGDPHPCLIFGRDAGRPLYNMAVGGGLMIFTLPIGARLFLSGLLVLAVHSWRRRKRLSFDRTG